MNKVDKLLDRINWHKNSGGFSNNLKPLLNFKYKHLLPSIYQEFYEKIGIGEIGSDSDISDGYLIVRISEPEFHLEHPDWDAACDGWDDTSNKKSNIWFNSEKTSKRDEVLLLGHDVDRQWFAYDINKNIFVSQWDDAKRWKMEDLVSYVEYIIHSNEEYKGIKFPY
jgi:hypothetical protein